LRSAKHGDIQLPCFGTSTATHHAFLCIGPYSWGMSWHSAALDPAQPTFSNCLNLFAADDDYVSSWIFNPVRGWRLCVVITTVHLRGVIIARRFWNKTLSRGTISW